METQRIGSRIVEARKKKNLSQAQLAQQLFISPQAVGKWERGESMPDILMLNRLATTLSVDLNYFSEDFQSSEKEVEIVELPLASHLDDTPSKNVKTGRGWDMSRGNWVDADFSGLKNLHDRFSGSNMQRCIFVDSDLSGLLLKNNHVVGCDFSGANLRGSQLHHSHMDKNVFTNSSLRETDILATHISNSDFTGADFSGSTLRSVAFEKNVLTDAIWNHTTFKSTHLSDVVLEGAIEDCQFDQCSFRKVTFQNAILINTFFKSDNLKRIRFVECQADRITYAFLKNGKADMSGITLINA